MRGLVLLNVIDNANKFDEIWQKSVSYRSLVSKSLKIKVEQRNLILCHLIKFLMKSYFLVELNCKLCA